MIVIGGSYFEYCHFPQWSQLYGSGLRAVIALSELIKCSFYTVSSPESKPILEVYSKQFDFQLYDENNKKTPEFNYIHPLSNPNIYLGSEKKIKKSIQEKNVIMFGMLDAEYIVDADNVVYDPQAPSAPRYFHENGSRAKRIIYVLNSKEAINLSGINDIEKAGERLLLDNELLAVIIKCDVRGVYIIEKNNVTYLPPFNTKRVWLIGSGDIFTSSFGYFWMQKKYSVHEAVRNALYYTAFYCETMILPLPKEITSFYGFSALETNLIESSLKGRVYLAGSFFTISQLWFINEIREIFINKGINVFSPIHEIGLGDADYVAQKDLEALEKSKLVFAVLDDFDIGSVFEIGYARSKSKPVIIYTSNPKESDLTMFKGTECEVYDDLSTAIYKAIWKLASL